MTRTSNPACSSEQVVALQYAVILVIGVERDFGSCAARFGLWTRPLKFDFLVTY